MSAPLDTALEAPARKMILPNHFDPYVLTPLDHSTAPVHFSFFVSFLCQYPASGLSVLVKDVERLTTLLPFLTGNLVQSTQQKGIKNVFEVQPPDLSYLSQLPLLKIKYHPYCVSQNNGNFNTPALRFDDLFTSHYMPLSFCPTHGPQPVLRLQANVMTNGIVLCLSFHHFAVDGIGLSSIMQALSACCRSPDQTLERLPTSPECEAQVRTKRFESTIEEYLSIYKGYGSYSWKAAPSSDLGAPISRRVCLDAEKIRSLQDVCNATVIANDYQASVSFSGSEQGSGWQGFSNNEVVTALIWLCGMRARSRATSKENDKFFLDDSHSSLLFPVDVRGILDIPSAYMGNAVVTPTATYHFQGEELHDTNIYVDANTSGIHEFNPDDITLLTNLALSVQTTVRSVNRNYVQNVISQIMASDGWKVPAKPGDLSVSSLRRARVYEMDFGPCLGPPCDFDVPDNRTDGLSWIMPPRSESSARLMGYQSKGFWEVRMALDPIAMESLRNDMLWREITLEEHRCCRIRLIN